ncbi:hypothetical protein K443DRAFT_671525 [Laccaria amethystina LaAM-08-1]|uniref:Uncharacterized protein n=1 Tax=Laccaria amethystina LaAM-08-1 TaxID=1095629 RepID=A0A0C9YNQ6_9AGAR|nr:hypothetical protein K443DRAFT_671525 [Laccaria amethystina LaAM-08-1]
MPTQVQNRPTESPHYDKFEHDARKNLQHKEALRVALGSILAPKRSPLAHGSRSSSGTASPAYPFPLPPTPPIPPSAYGGGPIDYLHPMHGLYQPHPHTPSRLGRSQSSNSNSPRETSASNSPHASPLPIPPAATADSPLPSPLEPDGLSPLPPSAMSVEGADAIPHIRGVPPPPPVVRPTPMPVQRRRRPSAPPLSGDGGSVPPSGAATPRAKFLETLGSKSAWDALIHGSFS